MEKDPGEMTNLINDEKYDEIELEMRKQAEYLKKSTNTSG